MLIKTIYKTYIKSSFVKNILALFTGSALAQLIIFLIIPILTRLFDEEAFGVYALFTSTIFLLKTLSTLCYELAIILPKRDKDAINLLVFSSLIVFLFSLLILIVIILFQHQINTFLGIEKLGNIIFAVPLSIFFIGNISILEYWNNRSNLFKNISIGNVSKAMTLSSSQLAIGFSKFKFIGLVPGLILGQLVQLLVILKLGYKTLQKNFKQISFKRMLYLAKKYSDIPKFNTVLTFTNTLSNELPIILITKYFGIGYAGIYGLAIKVSKTPPGIIGQSISQVFFNKASKLYNKNGNLYKLIKDTYKHLFVISILIFTPLFIASYFLDFIFGENWDSVGTFVRILIPWLFAMFLNSPVSSIIAILNKQKTILLYDIALLTSRFLALYLGYTIYNDIFISLMLFSGVGVLFNTLILIYFLKVAKESGSETLKAYKK